MRNALLLVLVGASACAARAPHTTLHAEYNCGDVAVTRDGTEMRTPQQDVLSRLSWHDSSGDHFVSWPLSPTDREAIEFVVPTDPRQDAVQHKYDTTFGSSTSDWRLVEQKTCRAHAGYNDLLARYMAGESIDDISHDIASDRDETRDLIRKAMVALQRRYWRDR